jgi:hypothetical protein
MRLFSLLAALAATCSSALCTDPPAKEPVVVRPAKWWSDLNRISDGGGSTLKSTTKLISDAEEFAKAWNQLGLKGEAPTINFKDYVVVVVFRQSGVDFKLSGGLETDAKGHAKVVGPPAHRIATNAGWYSTTIGVFPRKGIVSIEGQKLGR